MKYISTYDIPELPLDHDIMTPAIWKQVILARDALARMRGIAQTIPSQSILINTLSIQESKDSSEVESIVTTHDELFQYDKKLTNFSPANKEVHRYNSAMFAGFEHIQGGKPLTINLLVEISQLITQRDAGFRDVPGTVLRDGDGNIVYIPPQDLQNIREHMKNLETFINNNDMNNLDPLVKMAIIHHQFESIHPFFDGNGRTGRILNILYLIDQNLLDIPILYLSRYITQHKAQYYDLLQKTRSGESWEEWILFMVRAVEMTAKQTVGTIESIRQLMAEYKDTMRKQTKNYSHELINMLFAHPYTKIEYVSHALGVNRQTASRYLQELADIGLLQSEKQGRTIYYINTRLLDLFKSL